MSDALTLAALGLAGKALPSAALPSALATLGVSGTTASIFIAASNAPQAVKNRANIVCDGTTDAAVIQAVINGFPSAGPQMDGGLNYVTGGIKGSIELSEGQFNLASPLTVPPGSIFSMHGQGRTSWIPINVLSGNPTGGTILYSTDPTGKAFQALMSSFGKPATGLSIRDLDFRVFNPATKGGSNIFAVNVDGMVTGDLQRINILADTGTNYTPNIYGGITIQPGAYSDNKFVSEIAAYSFYSIGIYINTTHLMALGLSSGNVTVDTFARAILITPADDCFFAGLHAFNAKYGIGITNNAALQLIIESIHLEACTTAMLIDSVNPVTINTANLDSNTAWSGDITTKARVNNLQKKDKPTNQAVAIGRVTLPSGSNIVTFPHNLLVAPLSIQLTPLGDVGSGIRSWASADATNVYVNTSANLAANVQFDITARITR